ncbi:cytochrome b/b6 domain-containing protein [Cupriavidus pauculus]|uniref:cytochrome b/b6 domain-containing protein n=1 Tax=Cupriavidus pauculus TaxID=82633 RepID=UPI001EE1DAF3|nr:cytochrome b/b6 domain-containing protein [Cupriavidus pauculus]GJG94855.1 cytochrome B oxidoreductase [Cupriavidus pauculus]
MATPADRVQASGTIRVWDLAVRFTHWSVAAIVFYDVIDDSGDLLHRQLGYVAAGLVLFRIVWGFVGTEHARFGAWLPRPAGVLAYGRALLHGRAPRFVSHTPLGAVMMLATWTLILALAITGWMSRLDPFWGEDWPIDIHRWLSNTLLGLVAVHVVAAIAMSLKGRENLIAAMLTGRKRRNSGHDTDHRS